MDKTKFKAAAVTGVPTFLVAKYIFDASNTKAVIAAAIVAGLAIALLSISFPTPQNQTIPTV